jgi:hypothetical protein
MCEIEELREIKRIIPLIGKTSSVVDGYMEGDIIELLILLAKYKYNDIFEYVCKCISESPLPTFKDANKYMLFYINDEKSRGQYNRFINVFDDYHIQILTKYK